MDEWKKLHEHSLFGDADTTEEILQGTRIGECTKLRTVADTVNGMTSGYSQRSRPGKFLWRTTMAPLVRCAQQLCPPDRLMCQSFRHGFSVKCPVIQRQDERLLEKAELEANGDQSSLTAQLEKLKQTLINLTSQTGHTSKYSSSLSRPSGHTTRAPTAPQNYRPKKPRVSPPRPSQSPALTVQKPTSTERREPGGSPPSGPSVPPNRSRIISTRQAPFSHRPSHSKKPSTSSSTLRDSEGDTESKEESSGDTDPNHISQALTSFLITVGSMVKTGCTRALDYSRRILGTLRPWGTTKTKQHAPHSRGSEGKWPGFSSIRRFFGKHQPSQTDRGTIHSHGRNEFVEPDPPPSRVSSGANHEMPVHT
ncbi:hypothetical protein DB88DRAFT_469620 [Papiliotrema laurentii]|uniref:Uncharacterized protein n=1 Tax=Papiliotrema laurentii TaxID=5418 RepID=A0AAD9FVJ0_PAPLA|nr:hypothetical protein DB88DRAFT_469620 [Papiliotrema laurentii]